VKLAHDHYGKEQINDHMIWCMTVRLIWLFHHSALAIQLLANGCWWRLGSKTLNIMLWPWGTTMDKESNRDICVSKKK